MADSYLDKHPLPLWARALVVIIVTTFIIISNLTNIIVLRRIDGIPRIAKVCLVNLGLADLAVGAITCLLSVLPAFLGRWPYGGIMCQVSGVIHGSSATVSIWTLAIISVDRYIALVKPMKYPLWMSLKRVCIVICIIWILAISMFVAPILITPGLNYYQYSNPEIMCGLYWEYPWFCIFTAAVVHVASATIIVICTIKIALSICKVNAILKTSVYDPKQIVKRRRELKAVRTLVITAITFFLFWGPYVGSVLLHSFDQTIRPPPVLEFVFVWMANSNSFINVLIYSYLYTTFRNEIRLLLICVIPVCRDCVTMETVSRRQSCQELPHIYNTERRDSNVRY